MRFSRYAFVAALLALGVPLAAQQTVGGTITGKVTDAETKLPILDARVVIAGGFEATTNQTGDYRLVNVRAGAVQVRVFRIGFASSSQLVNVIAAQATTANFRMTKSVVNLSEVVVTGTAGNQERKAQAALVASVSAADVIKDAPITSVANLLQSRVPGVALTGQSGTAGTATQIRIRGNSSINLSNQPLIFIDGIRINEGFTASGQSGQQYDRLNDLSPEEIESIEVVKGPAAATLYGADASAGVIQIITKKGRAGSNSFVQNLRVESGVADLRYTPPNNYGLCTAALIVTTSTNPLCRGQTVGLLVSDNPLTRIGAFRQGTDKVLNYSARGGGQNYGYSVSYGQQLTDGTLPNNYFNRYNVRTNVNYVANPKLNLDIGLGLVQTTTDLPDNDNNIYGWFGGGLLGSPLTRTADGSSFDGFYGANRHYGAISAIKRQQLTHRVTTSVTANYAPFAWFTNRVTGGMDFASDELQSFFPKNDSSWYGGALNTGQNAVNRNGAERYTFDYLGNVKREFGSHFEANLSGGVQVIATRNTALGVLGLGLVTNANNSVTSAATTSGTGGQTEQRQVGYLSQLQVGMDNRRFLQLGLRVDKNSSFGSTAPAFVLPKIGFSWAVSEENFFQPLTRVVNTLRLRTAYGTTGRSPNPGDALNTLVSAAYNIAGSTAAGAIPGNPGNATLKPERGSEFEAGFDAGFFNNRLSAEVTYFNKKTNDLIIARPIPPSLGFNGTLGYPLANIGSVLNSGLEVALNLSAINKPNLRWDVRVGANTLRNELTSLGSGADSVLPFVLGGAGRTIVGQQLGVFVSKKIQSVDLATKVVTVSDTLTPMGNLLPTFEWNISNTVTVFRNLRLSALLDAKSNFLVQNFTAYFRETQLVRSNLRLDTLALSPLQRLRRFGNPTAGQPAFVTTTGKAATVSDVIDDYLEKGDFVRLREVSATYTVPDTWMARVSRYTKGASLTFAVQNVKLWTDYSGADPEINSQTNAFSRQDFLTLPNPRKIVLRLNFTF